MDFQILFRSRCMITDGAMGTYYTERYGKDSGSPEKDNLTDAEKNEIKQLIHVLEEQLEGKEQ